VRVLVTGGTGYLGRAIVRALISRGHAPVVFARSASTAGMGEGIDAIEGDVRDRAALISAARGCEALCHTAALVSIWRRDPSDFDAVNVGGLRHALDAAREAGVTRMVYTSSFLARPPAGESHPVSLNDYQRTKIAADVVATRARDAGAPLVALYPGVIYGPGVLTEGNLVGRLLSDFARGRLPGLVGPERLWSFSWVDDVAATHVAALERGAAGSSYEVGGENAPVRRAFEIAVTQGVGRRVPRRVPHRLATVVGGLEELRVRVRGGTPRVTRGAVAIFKYDWPMDHAEATRDLGHVVTPLATGIAKTLAELREAGTPGRQST
jgi:farnesol dehydrogenase